jgi:HD superfamily phosphohydrolase
MEVRDPVHGSIHIQKEEVPIIENPFFQRLRNIKQLGFSEFVFPGATHTRYLHSIGVMDVASKAFDQLFKAEQTIEHKRLRETVRLACLLHDIGHAPLSHTTEFVMPMVKSLKLPKQFEPEHDRQATHEDYTIKSIVDSPLTDDFKLIINKYGLDPNHIAQLVTGECFDEAAFIIDGIDYFPMLHQLVSSEMDCDRMDYLLRDSYFCGVSYGKYDLDWIIDNLKTCVVDNRAYVGISERAIATFDDFLLSRFHMFLMVYFHYKSVCLEKLLKRYFESAPMEYSIPSDIEEYLEHDDHYLMKVLRNSSNEWANKITTNRIPKKIFETFSNTQNQQLADLESFLNGKEIDYIKCSSKGRLSKYYVAGQSHDNKYPTKVIREHGILKEATFVQNINEATDLYEKFSKTHMVNRIHCEWEELGQSDQQEIMKIIKN